MAIYELDSIAPRLADTAWVADSAQVMGNVELGMVRVPSELLVDLIHHGDIQHYYDVDAVPVAR